MRSYENDATKKVPSDDKKKFHWFNIAKTTQFVPLVVYFDIEDILAPIQTCASAPNASR